MMQHLNGPLPYNTLGRSSELLSEVFRDDHELCLFHQRLLKLSAKHLKMPEL